MSSKNNQNRRVPSSDSKTSIRESLSRLESMLLESEIRLREILLAQSKDELTPIQEAELPGLKRTVESIRRVKEIFERKI